MVVEDKEVISTTSPSTGASRRPNESSPLSEDDLRERLCINSPELTAELYQIAQRQIQSETGRQTRLDAKAVSLLTAAGLSSTVAFTFGGTLIMQAHAFGRCTIGLYVLAVFLGLTASSYAVLALRVQSKYLALDEATIFDPKILKEANSPSTLRDDTKDEDVRRFGLMEYQKYLIPQMWVTGQAQYTNHEKKARLIQKGQSLFLAFLATSFLVCISLAFGVSSQRERKETPSRASTTSSEAPTGSHRESEASPAYSQSRNPTEGASHTWGKRNR